MKKIVKISIADIVLDPAAASQLLSKSCLRKKGNALSVRGCCTSAAPPALLFLLDDELKLSNPPEYHLAPMPIPNDEELVAEINARYLAGQTLRGTFKAGRREWAFYEVFPEEKQGKA